MIFHKIEKLYGIDYKTYACGGIGNAKLCFTGDNRELFYTEADMLEKLSQLKRECTCDNFELFTTTITKEKYNL